MDLDYELYAPSYRLPCVSKRITYGLGNILNDLTSTVYYNFILLYLMNVVELKFAHVGYVFLFGQAVSAIASVAADHVGQHRNALCCCYSRRKSWHLIGSLLAIIGFLFLFMACIGCSKIESVYKTLYYGGFILLFQLGWSFVQSSHLRLIPEITRNQHERIELNAIRYSVGLVAQIVIFAVVWLLFSLSTKSSIDSSDQTWFRTLGITVVAIGFVSSAFFHIGTDETGYDLFLETHLSASSYDRMTRTQWAKEPQFYQIFFLYLFTRVSANVAVLYLPLYVSQTLDLHKVYLAVYPFAALLGSTFIPFLMRPLVRCASAKVTYVIGSVLVMGIAVWAWFINNTWPMYELQMFAFVVLLGAGGSVMTFSSLTMAQTLIGDNTDSGSFVFSSMSVVAKLMTGVAILVIQQLNNCSLATTCEAQYYRYVFTGVVGGAAGLGFIILLTLLMVKLGRLRYANVLVRTTTKTEENGTADPHMDYFEATPEEDCFNYWSCLSTSREPEAHNVAIMYSSPYTIHRHVPSINSSSSINAPYDIPGVRRVHSSASLDGLPTYDTLMRTSSSAPSIIEYSGNHEQHHKKKNHPRRAPLKTKDTAQLLDNEQLPELTDGLPPAAGASQVAGASAAAAAEPTTSDPSGTSIQVDIHPVPNDVHPNSDNTIREGGSPYDNVQITVTPGGKIIDPEAKA